jgi:SAM-dependent methyltransferase
MDPRPDLETGNVSDRMRSDWNQRAKEDPFFYVGFARRNQNIEEFQASAGSVMPLLEAALDRLRPSGQSPLRAGGSPRRALEIGCGPGRLMVPMSRHFDEIHGVDVSDEMIALGRQLLAQVANAHLHVNNGSDLSMFPDAYFDYIYSCVVFQHIPSKSIVFGYLREVERVLKVGGVFCGQFRGSAGPERPDTWNGCAFTGDEIADHISTRGLLLVAISGEGTQYMDVTLKRGERVATPDLSGAGISAVTAVDGSGSVPQRGRGAGICLWCRGLPDTSDLVDLRVAINGAATRGCYLSPIGPQGAGQLNALLPRAVSVGRAQVALNYRGAPAGGAWIEVTPSPAWVPKIGAVTDGIDLLSNSRIGCGCLKATVEEVESPADVSFYFDGQRAERIHYQCVDSHLGHYHYTVDLPGGIRQGTCIMVVRVGPLELAPMEIEVL